MYGLMGDVVSLFRDISELLKTPSRSTKKAVLGGSVRKLGSARKRMGGALKGKVTTNVEVGC